MSRRFLDAAVAQRVQDERGQANTRSGRIFHPGAQDGVATGVQSPEQKPQSLDGEKIGSIERSGPGGRGTVSAEQRQHNHIERIARCLQIMPRVVFAAPDFLALKGRSTEPLPRPLYRFDAGSQVVHRRDLRRPVRHRAQDFHGLAMKHQYTRMAPQSIGECFGRHAQEFRVVQRLVCVEHHFHRRAVHEDQFGARQCAGEIERQAGQITRESGAHRVRDAVRAVPFFQNF